MASYPSAKVHRTARNKLGRGQQISQPIAEMTFAAGESEHATFTFNMPVVLNGVVNMNFSAPQGVVTNEMVNATTLVVNWTESSLPVDFSISPTDPAIRTFQGGGTTGCSGTVSD